MNTFINFLFIYFLFISSYCFSQNNKSINLNGYNKFFYENGTISSEGTMVDGKPNGYWKTYYENGKIKTEGNRKKFQLDSIWKFYDEKGIINFEIFYVEGKKNGLKTVWKNGKYIFSEENIVADIKQGNTYYYFKPEDSLQVKGKIKIKIPFDKGRENGTAYEYDKDGNIISILEYNYGIKKNEEFINRYDKNGNKEGVWKDFYGNEKVKSETRYSSGKKSGYQKLYTEKGSLLSIDKYNGDSIVKVAPELTTNLETKNEYYEDGRIKKTCTYLFGLADGMQKEYSEDGKIIQAKGFKEGKLISSGTLDEIGRLQGVWTEFHSNETIKSVGLYVDGIKTGEWIYYYPNGKVEQKGKYDKLGNPVGLWNWFFESGNKLLEENYVNGKREGFLTEWGESKIDSLGKYSIKEVTKGEYVDGLKEGSWVYEIQDYREEGAYLNDQKNGHWKSYFTDNNQLRFVGNYVEGLPDGKHIYYFHDGNIEEQGNYIVGNKEGNWEYFNPDGTILLTVTFKSNKEIKFDGLQVKPLLPGENFK